MSSKRFGKSKILREGYRRSPRLSALEDCKASGDTRLGAIAGNTTSTQQMKSYLGYDQGPASMTRGRKKRRVAPYDEAAYHSRSASPNSGLVEISKEGNQTSGDSMVVWRKDIGKPASTDQQSSALSALLLPEKRILELVLDILQRRDTYEIFAEPVNPNEVPDYYELIEEPMDFGTMRAKLHEGIYKNLQEFEHDAFLVTENAMYFNSTATVYFRQARSIHDLAKKVFHMLKTYPEKLESEFLEARQRTGTRRGPAKTRCSGNDKGERKLLYGTKDGGKPRSFEADRRYTYQHSNSFLSEHESIGLSLPSDPKQLEHVNHQDIYYRESLMSFVKDLGPTAKMIARKKILGCLRLQESHYPLESCPQQAPSTTAFAAVPSHGRHPTIMKTARTTFQLPSSGDQSNSHGKFYQNHTNEIHHFDSYRLRAHTDDKSTSMTPNQGKLPNRAGSMVSPSDSQSNVLKRLKIASLSHKSCTYKLAPAPLGEDDETIAAQGQNHNINSLFQTRQMPKPDQFNPLAQQSTFDLPYLRAQLGKISSSGEDQYLQNGSSGQLQFLRLSM